VLFIIIFGTLSFPVSAREKMGEVTNIESTGYSYVGVSVSNQT